MASTWTVLIVDDDPAMRQLGRARLEKLGLIVTEAADGRQAIEVFKQCQADLVLLDASMPKMDGFEACQRIRKLRFGDDIPIIMVTAFASSDSAKQAIAAGATEFVTKPINWADLGARIRNYLAHRATLPID